MRKLAALCSVSLLLLLASSGFAQDELLGKTRAEALKALSGTPEILEGKSYPLIKETIKVDGVRKWDRRAIVYLFVDSSDRISRVHYILNELTAKTKEQVAAALKEQVKSIEDLSDKQFVTYNGRTKSEDYLLTWSKNKKETTGYLVISTIDFKNRMLNYMLKGNGNLPQDGIFTPTPAK